MKFARNYIGLLKRGNAEKSHNTTLKPKEMDTRKMFLTGFLMLLVGCSMLLPAAAIAQTTGSSPTFNATVQGESASTVEGTFANIVNYAGNTLCPLGAGLGVVATAVQYFRGKGVTTPLVGTGILLGVSGVTRLMESMVTNGQSAVK